jgi:hypothetical protein
MTTTRLCLVSAAMLSLVVSSGAASAAVDATRARDGQTARTLVVRQADVPSWKWAGVLLPCPARNVGVPVTARATSSHTGLGGHVWSVALVAPTLVDARAAYDRIGARVLPCLASFWAESTASVEVRATVYGESLGDASRAWIVVPRGRGRHNPLHVVAVRVGRAVAYFPYVTADAGQPQDTIVRQAIRRAVQRVERRNAKRERALVTALVFRRSQIPHHWAPQATRHESSSTNHVYRGARIAVTARKEAGWYDLGRIMVSVAETTPTPTLLYRALSRELPDCVIASLRTSYGASHFVVRHVSVSLADVGSGLRITGYDRKGGKKLVEQTVVIARVGPAVAHYVVAYVAPPDYRASGMERIRAALARGEALR